MRVSANELSSISSKSQTNSIQKRYATDVSVDDASYIKPAEYWAKLMR